MIDAYGELVDEGCLAVVGPNISENTVVLVEEIDRRFRVPSIGLCGSDDWLGEWTFGLPNGSMTDEPIVIAHLMAQAGLHTAGVLFERSFIGHEYLKGFRNACRDEDVRIAFELDLLNVPHFYSNTPMEIPEHAFEVIRPSAIDGRTIVVELASESSLARVQELLMHSRRPAAGERRLFIDYAAQNQMEHTKYWQADHTMGYCHGMIQRVNTMMPTWKARSELHEIAQ